MKLSAGKKVLYALGQFGLVLCAFAVGNLFVSFFVTRSFIDTVIFPVYINQGYFFEYFTAAGLIVAFCKLFDAGAGLYFGYASDRNKMKKGRRTGFMLVAAIPLPVFSILVFCPPTNTAFFMNSVYVLVCTVIFYFFLSLYTTPYLALLSELGKSPRERMQLSTMLAGATALASLLGNRIFYFMEYIRSVFGLSFVLSFRLILIIYASVSCLCMMLPVMCIEEKKYCQSVPVKDSFSVSVKAVLKDSYFRPFFIADIMYRIAFAFTLAGFSYYVTVLLSLPTAMVAFFLVLIFFTNLVLFFPVSILTRFIGKKKILFAAVFLFITALAASVFAGKYPVDPFIQGMILSILVALPLSVFSVVPNALVSDLVVASERKTGIQRGGMYFGVQSLSIKTGQLVAALLFPSLMTLGATASRSAGRWGLRITLILAAVFSVTGFLFLSGYREKEITVLLENND